MTTTSDEVDESGSPLESIAAFLRQEGWSYEEMGEQNILRTTFRGSYQEWLCLLYYQPQSAYCLFYSVAPKRVPAVLRPAVTEYLTRANWGLLYGNFELDYQDGEVRFRTSIPVSQSAFTLESLRSLIFSNVAIMDRYLPGLEAVLALERTPSEAILALENPSSEPDAMQDLSGG